MSERDAAQVWGAEWDFRIKELGWSVLRQAIRDLSNAKERKAAIRFLSRDLWNPRSRAFFWNELLGLRRDTVIAELHRRGLLQNETGAAAPATDPKTPAPLGGVECLLRKIS